MKKIPLSKIKDDLSRYLHLAEAEEIVITRHGKPAGVLRGFESEDDWFDYRLEHDASFLRRIDRARADVRAGKGYGSRIFPSSRKCGSVVSRLYSEVA
jgi:prevent-host-death family protein